MNKWMTAGAAAAMLALGSAQAADKLMGYTEGAQVADVPAAEAKIDAISGIVYNQVFERGRSVRGLKMTLFIPNTKAKKPAVLYFPGGGFTSADHEKYLQMRYALTRAGFVVAACEYRTVPNKFPALLEDGKAAVRWVRAHASLAHRHSRRLGGRLRRADDGRDQRRKEVGRR